MNMLVAGALLCALAADPTQEQSSTRNNSANRAEAQAPTQAEMARVPGGRATPKSEWKTGDSRGKPQARKAKKQRRAAKAKESQR